MRARVRRARARGACACHQDHWSRYATPALPLRTRTGAPSVRLPLGRGAGAPSLRLTRPSPLAPARACAQEQPRHQQCHAGHAQ